MATPRRPPSPAIPTSGSRSRTGWVRVDLHSHTMWSGDSTTTAEELEEARGQLGLDVLCITDHNAVKGAKELSGRLPCRVVVGEELRTHAGEIIGLFLTEHVPFGVPPGDAARLIRDQGGVVYVPHPFDPMRRNLAEPALVALVEAGPDRRRRGLQRQDVAAPPQRAGGRLRRRARPGGRRGQRRARARGPRRGLRRDARLRRAGRLPGQAAGSAASSATTPIPTERGGRASCRARRAEIPAAPGPARGRAPSLARLPTT